MASVSNFTAGRYGADPTRVIDMTLDLSATGENVSSYPTGGFDLPAALDSLVPQGFVGRTMAVKANTTHYAAWNAATRKVQMYTDVDLSTEVSDTTDLTSVTAAPMFVIGY